MSDSVTLDNSTDTTINILKFDTANDISEGGSPTTVGATLTNVEITVKAIVSGASVQMDNDNGAANTATASVTNLVNTFVVTNVFSDPLDGIDLQVNSQEVFELSATGIDPVGYTETLGPDWATFDPGSQEGVTTGSYAGATAIALGYSTTTLNEAIAFTLNSSYSTTATFSGANGFFQGNTPTGQYEVEVIYTYSPVPEPSTYAALFGAAALAFVGLRRRR